MEENFKLKISYYYQEVTEHIRYFVPCLIFSLSLLGYPAFQAILQSITIPTASASVVYRCIVVFLSIISILICLKRIRISKNNIYFAVFLTLYLFRLLWDFLMQSIIPNVEHALLFYIIVCYIPILSMLLYKNDINEGCVLWLLFILSSTVMLGVLLFFVLFWTKIDEVNLTVMGYHPGRLSLQKLNPVSLGNAAVTSIIVSFIFFVKKPEALKVITKILLFCLITISLWVLYKTAARGAILSLFVVIVFYILSKNIRLMFFLFSVFAFILFMSFNSENLNIILSHLRLSNIYHEPSFLERVVLLETTLVKIIENPVIGSGYALPTSGGYSHNIFLDAGLSMGIPGILALSYMALMGVSRAWVFCREGKNLTFALLYIQYLCVAQFSGNLWSSNDFLTCLLMLI